jgi:hypothetical protein
MENNMAEAKKIKARVLTACALGQPNDVVEIDVSEAKALVDLVDTDPKAVAYAETLTAEQ